MGCVSTIAGCILVTLNTLFLLIALVIGVVGGFIKWGAVDLLKKPLENFVAPSFSKATQTDVTNFLNEFLNFLRQYGLPIFIVGIVLAVITLLAICGVCCQSKCLLIVYAFIVFLFLGGMTTVTVLTFLKKDDIKNAGGNELRKFVVEVYRGPNSMDKLFTGVSGVLDVIQVKAECCGVTNYTDFYEAAKWTNRTFEATVSGTTYAVNLTIPPSCCKMTVSGKSVEFDDNTCLMSPNATNSNIDTACYDKLWDAVDRFWDIVKYVLIGVTAFILLLFLAAMCAMRFEKEKIDPI